MFGIGIGIGLGGGVKAAANAVVSSPLAVFGASLIGDWDVGNSANVTLDGSLNIQSVADLSGNSRTVSQVTAGLRPGYTASGGGGGKGFAINGTGTWLITGNLTIPQPVEVFIIGRMTTQAGGNAYLIDFATNVNILFQQGGLASLQQYSGTLGATGAITLNQDFLADGLYSGASSQLAINGGGFAVADAGIGGSSATGITLGNAGGGGSGFQGRWSRMFAISRAATAPERAQMHALAQTYGVP